MEQPAGDLPLLQITDVTPRIVLYIKQHSLSQRGVRRTMPRRRGENDVVLPVDERMTGVTATSV